MSEILDRLANKIDEPVDKRTIYCDMRYLIEIGLVVACPKTNGPEQVHFRLVQQSELAGWLAYP